MKATKIVLGIAVAAAVVFTSCKDMGGALGTVPISEDIKPNETTKAEVTGTVNYENTSKDMARGMKLFSNKKKGIVLKFQLQDLTSDNQNPGLLGLVFDMEKNEDGTYNFVVFGMRNEKGNPKYYISYYRNISESAFSSKDFGVDAKNRITVKDGETIKESDLDVSYFTRDEPVAVDIVGWKTLDAIKLTEGTLNLGICVQPLKASKDDANFINDEDNGGEDENNAYNIYLYKADDVDVTKLGTVKEPKKSKSDGQDIDSEIILNKDNPIPIPRIAIGAGKWDGTNFKPSSKKLQGQMGFYANVYGSQTLKGEWQVADIAHEPNLSRVAESNQDNPLNIQISY